VVVVAAGDTATLGGLGGIVGGDSRHRWGAVPVPSGSESVRHIENVFYFRIENKFYLGFFSVRRPEWRVREGGVKEPNANAKREGRIALPFWRRQWKKLVAIMDDHPYPFLLGGILAGILVVFYAVPLRGASHCVESLRRWKLEMVGGEYEIDRAVRIYDVMLSFEPAEHDRVDIVSMGGVPLVGSAFRREIETVVEARNGRVRFLALDPRVSEPGHPSHGEFKALAEELGEEPWEFRASVWHAAAVLLRLGESLGAGFEVRFVTGQEGVGGRPGFVGAPWVSAYESGNPRRRMDFMALEGGNHAGKDFSARPARLLVNRPDSREAVERGRRFAEWWEKSAVPDAGMREEFMAHLAR